MRLTSLGHTHSTPKIAINLASSETFMNYHNTCTGDISPMVSQQFFRNCVAFNTSMSRSWAVLDKDKKGYGMLPTYLLDISLISPFTLELPPTRSIFLLNRRKLCFTVVLSSFIHDPPVTLVREQPSQIIPVQHFAYACVVYP